MAFGLALAPASGNFGRRHWNDIPPEDRIDELTLPLFADPATQTHSSEMADHLETITANKPAANVYSRSISSCQSCVIWKIQPNARILRSPMVAERQRQNSGIFAENHRYCGYHP